MRLDDEYGHRALAIAEAVAATPAIRDALQGPNPAATIQPVAEGVRKGSGALYVVVMDRAGVRYSHPDPTLIGKKVDDAGPALDGNPWIGPDTGALGPSMRGKAPIFDASGAVIGVVSVGFHEDVISSALIHELPSVGITLGLALALGVVGSLLLARHLKRKTFGLEPDEIAGLLEQREAILHGIREGTVAADLRGRVTLVNDEARDLLGLDGDCVGQRVCDLPLPARIREMLSGGNAQRDEVVLAGERLLLANRMPVVARGGTIGSVVTLRDRTELEGVLRQLDEVRNLSEALRAQAHEFSNRLHTIAGLIELGRADEALGLIGRETALQQELVESLLQRVGNPVVSALLLGKSAVASERGVDFRLSDDTLLNQDVGDPRDLVTVVGNLVDNAIDAVAALPPDAERWVEVSARSDAGAIVVRVHDSGPGIDPALGDAIFDEGVSSKDAASGRKRGLGLALVRQVVQRHGGEIAVTSDGGSVFTVRLPLERSSPVAEPALR
jgi:two-component system CitB family sensor kinase